MGFPWTVPLLLVVAVLLIAVMPFGRRLVSGTHVARRTFWCPFRRMNVSVDFKSTDWDGARLDVDACTAFSPHVACDKECLLLRTFSAPRFETAPTP